MARIQDIDIPHLEFAEAAAPATPAASIVRIYAKSDGLLYQKDDAGAETLLASGASGAVATDAIWDAAGDLAVGSGANTAAKLAKGPAGANLSTYNGVVALNGGTSFPATPATGDRYWRSDLGMEAYYDGTRWLTTQLHTVSFPITHSNSTLPILGSLTAAAANMGRLPAPWSGVYGLYIVSMDWFLISTGAHSGTNYHTCKLNWADQADSDTQVGATMDSKTATSANNNYVFRITPGVALGTTVREFKVRLDKVASAPDITYTTTVMTYRIILT